MKTNNNTMIKTEEGEKKMIKHIIREIPAEQAELEFYFDGDTFNENSGDYNNTFFIVPRKGYRGYNEKAYQRIHDKAETIIDEFEALQENGYYAPNYNNYKEIMLDFNIPYNPTKCHKLKQWVENADIEDTGSIAQFLTILTGKLWIASSSHGYCQGDYCEYIYCSDNYTSTEAHIIGEIWLGCGKEFCLIDLDENGEETETCYGFILADRQCWNEQEMKKTLYEYTETSEEDTKIELIDDCHTYTKYSYKAI